LKISDLTGLLNKVQQIAGDVEVELQAAEGEAKSFITDLGIHLDPTTASAGGTLTITHGDAPPPPAPVEEPSDPAAGGAQTPQP
jgi:hypothetical protein